MLLLCRCMCCCSTSIGSWCSSLPVGSMDVCCAALDCTALPIFHAACLRRSPLAEGGPPVHPVMRLFFGPSLFPPPDYIWTRYVLGHKQRAHRVISRINQQHATRAACVQARQAASRKQHPGIMHQQQYAIRITHSHHKHDHPPSLSEAIIYYRSSTPRAKSLAYLIFFLFFDRLQRSIKLATPPEASSNPSPSDNKRERERALSNIWHTATLNIFRIQH